MTANLGTIDRIIRFVIGIVLLALPFVSNMAMFATPWVSIVSVVLGIIMLGTSAIRFCPLYRIFGIRTCAL